VWVSGDAVHFHAAITPTRYMTGSVYFLKRGPAPTLPERAVVTGDVSVEAYTAIVRAGQNKIYAPQAEGDTWFWERITAPATRTYTLTLSSNAAGPATLRLETWSSTEGSSEIDHRVRVSVNGHDAGEATWDGSVRRTLEFALPAGVLIEGDNSVRVSLPGDTGVLADTVYVDWVELAFPRRFVAQNDRLMFDSPGGRHQLIGFSGSIDVYDVTRPDRITRVSIDPSASFAGEKGHRYWAVGARGYQSGRVTAATLTPDLTAIKAEYVAIGPSDLVEPLQPLLDYHAAHGLTVATVPAAAVYDQFGDGRVDPAAIKTFLQAARPKYVLLVGDASYDPLGYTAPPEANRLPTLLVTTVFGGETGSDVGFAQLADDLKPVLAVGRVPARTADQVKVFVSKTLAYLQAPPSGAWRQRVLAVADGQEDTFKVQAQAFLDQFAPTYQTQLLNPLPNQVDANVPIVAALNEGNALVSYFGHGSVTQWGKDNLFTVKDGEALKASSGALPVVLNFTCLTGLFTHPKVQSLAETLLWQADAGAVAVLAPTSLTLGSDQSFLSEALVREFLANPTERLGDLVLKAWQAVPADSPSARDVLQTFLLFGDPALVVVGK
ncbi:partial Gingipain R2, partial [Planctomycetaceae bacterium]